MFRLWGGPDAPVQYNEIDRPFDQAPQAMAREKNGDLSATPALSRSLRDKNLTQNPRVCGRLWVVVHAQRSPESTTHAAHFA
jgi:hypothetical protein